MNLSRVLAAAIALAGPAQGQVALEFPGPAVETGSIEREFTSYKLPVGPYADGIIQTLVAEGKSVTKTWRVETGGGTTLLLMDSLRQQLEAAGFELLFECTTDVCGGFDFRFGTRVRPEPDMHVDLGDFRYLAAQRLGGAVPEYISLFVSRGADQAFVQMILVGSGDEASIPVQADGTTAQVVVAPADEEPAGTLIETLLRDGSAVLDDLEFETGSSALGNGEFRSLAALAAYLKDNPEVRIALVGHTDAEGSLDANIGLSRERARSVAARLASEYDIPPSRIEADGVGYLAPRANNLSEEGRTLNRRVEVIITSTQG